MKRALSVIGAMLAVSIAHYVTPPSHFLWHEILERLYYVPIIAGAIYFGWIGGLALAVLAGICYAPHVIAAWNNSPHDMAAKYAEIIVFVAVGLVTGILSDRERKRAHDLHLEKIRSVLEAGSGAKHEIRDPQSASER